MKKEWINASIETLDINETAFGPFNENTPDSEKTPVYGENGALEGWEQLFGEASR